MIFTDKAAKEKILALESRISELESDITTKDSAIDAHNSEVTARDQAIAEHVATIGTRDESITALTGEVETLKASVSTKDAELAAKDLEIEAAKSSAGQLATQTLASIGQPEPLAINGDEKSEAKELSREAFNALTPSARLAFVKDGGKLS